MAVNNQYTAESIESLSPLEFTRLRPGVYCGSTEYSTQLIIELFSNALDEHNLGHGNIIKVTVDKDNVITVTDEGQGFLVNEPREDGKTVFEAALSVLNTSGKYRDDGVYEGTSLGLNGIGAKLPTFLSHWLVGMTWRDGKYERVYFKEGVFEKRETDSYEKGVSGTAIKFKPSEEFFKHAEPDMKYLEKMFNDICGLCPGLTVEFNGKIINHANGIEYLVHDRAGDDIRITDNLVFQETKDKYKIDCGLCYSSRNSSDMTAYVNYGLTDSGPHITAIKSCITRVMNKWAKEQGLLKEKEKNLEGTALQEGLVLVFNLVAPGISYDAQTKSRIVSNEFVPFLNETFGKQLEIWLDNNPDYGKTIIEKALLARKAAEAAKKAREAVRAKVEIKEKKVLKLPSKLADCYGTDRSKCEIYITEGDSASGNLKQVRDNETQAILPVRGKILNTQKATLDKIMKNAEIMDMINAFGLKISADGKRVDYDKNKIRYGKIIIMSDADDDGSHIKNLFYTFIWNFAPQLFEDGFIYAGVPPLFRLKNNKEVVYLKDNDALEEFKKTKDISKYQISRLKGLGELSPEETEECLIDPATRIIKKVQVEDIGKADILFDNLMGTNVEPRKRYIEENAERAAIYV